MYFYHKLNDTLLKHTILNVSEYLTELVGSQHYTIFRIFIWPTFEYARAR